MSGREGGPLLGLDGGLRLKTGKEAVFFSFFNSYLLFKQTNKFEFKPRFESKHPKQCTGMNATLNSYISLIN
jgi:hypothetical protein